MSDTLFNKRIKSKKRNYYFDVKKAEGNYYLRINQSTLGKGSSKIDSILIEEENLDAFEASFIDCINYIRKNNKVVNEEKTVYDVIYENEALISSEVIKSEVATNRGKKWSKEDDELLEKYFFKGVPVKEIAIIFGRTEKSINIRFERLDLMTKMRKKLNMAQD
ncbi:MAG: hypothetical protein Kapaf2KO_03360 [Candidatus Kapaibacteriales bacterium]